MKTLLHVSCLILLIAVVAAAQNPPTAPTAQNTIYVGADGKFEAAPDTVLVTFGISAQEATSKEAYDHAARSSEQVRDLLRKNAIDPKSAQIGFFELQPVYDFRNPKRKLVGYRAASSVTLKLKDFSKVGPIVQGLSDLDITDDQTISYVLDNIDDAKIKASQDGLQRARAQANAVATAAGRTLGELVYASVDTFEPPRPMPMRAMAMSKMANAAPEPTAEFSAQNVTITAHVNAMFGLK